MKKVLIIGFVWPEPTTTAAGQRMLQLIQAFLGFGWDITFGSTAAKTEYSADLEKLGLKTTTLQLNHSSFDDFVKELNPDMVVFDRFMVEEQFGWRVAEQVPQALRILNTEDLHSLRKVREACHAKEGEFTLERWLTEDITKREIASIYRSDLSLLVSTFEMELLQDELKLPEEILMHLPFILDEISVEKTRDWPSFEKRIRFITYGNGKHAPNVDSIKYLEQTIWPLIRKELPEATLKVFGAYLPQQVLQMHNPKDGFLVEGWVEDLDSEIQKARVCLAPLRFGAGIKGKLTQAMQNGTPSVTSKIGAEGMHQNMDWPGDVADNLDNFVKASIALYNDSSFWQKAQENGIVLLNQYYSKSRLEEQLKSRLEALSKTLSQHRSNNFVGAMLQHQTMASTKFMGKWIEAKNKK